MTETNCCVSDKESLKTIADYENIFSRTIPSILSQLGQISANAKLLEGHGASFYSHKDSIDITGSFQQLTDFQKQNLGNLAFQIGEIGNVLFNSVFSNGPNGLLLQVNRLKCELELNELVMELESKLAEIKANYPHEYHRQEIPKEKIKLIQINDASIRNPSFELSQSIDFSVLDSVGFAYPSKQQPQQKSNLPSAMRSYSIGSNQSVAGIAPLSPPPTFTPPLSFADITPSFLPSPAVPIFPSAPTSEPILNAAVPLPPPPNFVPGEYSSLYANSSNLPSPPSAFAPIMFPPPNLLNSFPSPNLLASNVIPMPQDLLPTSPSFPSVPAPPPPSFFNNEANVNQNTNLNTFPLPPPPPFF